MTEPTERQLSTLRHMLGINTPMDKEPQPHRNYAAVSPGDAQFLEMEEAGLVERYSERPPYHWYTCTEHGKALAMASHKTIRAPRSKRRYNAFLRMRDSYQELTFREFLTDPYWAQARQEA